MRDERRFAVIDIGSNSIRYMTEDDGGKKLTVTTRLGSGLASTGRLDKERMAHSVRVISAMADNARHAGYTPVAYATSAVRDCSNQKEFLDRVFKASRVMPDVLSGEREAKYAYMAATGGKGGLIDIGGASMQLVSAFFARSYPIGCVRARDIAQSLTGTASCDQDFPRQREALCRHIESLTLEALPETADMRPLIGVGGTITTLGALSQCLTSYNKDRVHGAKLTVASLESLIEFLLSLGENRRKHPLLVRRHDVILYGAAILSKALGLLNINELTVSTRDGLEGYLEAAKSGELDLQ